MSSMEEQLGKGYQQIMIGLIVFIAGAIWGGMQATEGMVAEDVYWPAVMMGVADKTGTISQGKLADIIAVKGDVLRYINLLQRVDLVMKDGILYKQNGLPVEKNL